MRNTIILEEGSPTYHAEDPWVLLEDPQGALSGSAMILPLSRWQAIDAEQSTATDGPATGMSQHGVVLGPDDNPADLLPYLRRLPMIALQFPKFSDGRAYSQANLLRSRYGFCGDLRAVGDVLRDQLVLMRHCGFTSFAVRADRSVLDAMKAFTLYDEIYARSVAEPEPLYRRRKRSYATDVFPGTETR